MDWATILTAAGTVIAIVASNIALIGWIRSDMKDFINRIEGWKDTFSKEIYEYKTEISKEMHDFHTRLATQDLEFKMRLTAIEQKFKEKK